MRYRCVGLASRSLFCGYDTTDTHADLLLLNCQIVRSDNVKLWKHLEAAKDKQLVMQEKMKKIMWILFQIYRGKQQNLPQLSSNDATGAFISEE